MQQKEEKIRVYVLARELNMESKDLLDVCHKAGIDVKNQLSSLSPEQRDQVLHMVRQGSGGSVSTGVADRPKTLAPQPPVPPPIRVLETRKPPVLHPGRPPQRTEPEAPRPAPQAPVATPIEALQPPPQPDVVVEPSEEAEVSQTVPTVVVPSEEAPPPVAPAAETDSAALAVTAPSEAPPAVSEPEAETEPEPAPAPVVAETPEPEPQPVTPAAVAPPEPVKPPVVAAAQATQATQAAPVAPPSKPPAAPPTPPVAPSAPPAQATPPQAPPPPRAPEPPPAPRVPPTLGPSKMRDLNSNRGGPDSGGGQRNRRERPTLRPVMGPRMATPPPLKQPPRPPEDQKKPPAPAAGAPRKLMDLPDEVKQGKKSITIQELMAKKQQPAVPAVPPPPVDVGEIEDEDASGKKRPGAVAGRDARHKSRAARATARGSKGREGDKGHGAVALDDDMPERIKRRQKIKKPIQGTMPRKGKVPVSVPITVRSLCEALGIRSSDLLFKLRDHGITATINTTLDPEAAETLAVDYGIELEIKKPLDAEEQLLTELEKSDNPEDLVLRAPIVTIMGHVDHGKTSLLDRIRQSNVVATEAGGITQVLRAWRVEHGGRPITFLDTPGHEAFTKMRARGAHVTDIAVIVVAADDGVMPQTEEAVSHARAAGVSIVVAINKVDMPNANIERTRRQLYNLQLIPDTMGGDTPFVETSAATGQGINELLDMLSLVAELKELKANPKKPAGGTVLEAMLSEGEGVLATLLIQDGTLHRGDIVLAGSTHGRVRALYNDLGQQIQEAGPSVPVRITGLDQVPNADDRFQVVPDLATARDIAEKRMQKEQEAAAAPRVPMGLARLNEAKVAELKVILKADFRGSIEAIRKELEKLHHEEVRVRILEAGIGGITENDVWLALTSPEDTLIVGFNVVPDDRARALAEERHVQIREYSIIYNLTQDIRSALEGKLKPHEEIIHLGRASVRETFKISRVGTIAGCYVTQGKIERSAKVRVIRNGVVIFPPADRTASLESLKRFREDAREVAQGFECGIKIAGYDDVKVDDVIEAYRVEQVQRKLT